MLDHLIDPAQAATGVASPQSLRLARERRGKTATELSKDLGKSPSYVSRAESLTDPIEVSGEALAKYADVLGVPLALLRQDVHREPSEGTHFRSHKVTKRVQNQAIAEANLIAGSFNNLIEDNFIEFEAARSLGQYDPDTLPGGPAEIAHLLRAQWRLDGPLVNVAELLEAVGVLILPMPTHLEGIDAITVRTPGHLRAVTLLALDRPHARLRHTLAHELGHLVIDSTLPAPSMKEAEERVDVFAAELLAPYDDLRDDLDGITPQRINTLIDLHWTWGVHPTSLIRRAYRHGDISEAQYRYWFRVLNSRQLVRGNLPSQFPVVLSTGTALLAAAQQAGMSLLDMIQSCRQYETDLAPYFGDAWPFSQHRRRILQAVH